MALQSPRPDTPSVGLLIKRPGSAQCCSIRTQTWLCRSAKVYFAMGVVCDLIPRLLSLGNQISPPRSSRPHSSSSSKALLTRCHISCYMPIPTNLLARFKISISSMNPGCWERRALECDETVTRSKLYPPYLLYVEHDSGLQSYALSIWNRSVCWFLVFVSTVLQSRGHIVRPCVKLIRKVQNSYWWPFIYSFWQKNGRT